MKALIQRVKEAEVKVESKSVGKITQGLLILLGVAGSDTEKDADFLAQKILNLRIFPDENKRMNLSIQDIKGELLVVSQFTLIGDCKKGNRPSFDKAAKPEEAKRLCEYFIQRLKISNLKVASGVFGAMMQVSLVNDGPVTFLLESKK